MNLGCGGGGAAPGTTRDSATLDHGPGEEVVDVLADVEEDFGGMEDIGDGGDVGGEIQPGMPGWPCKDGKDCYSGYCIETPEGYRCTNLCMNENDCERGYKCLQVATFPDVVFACVHPAPRECRPCVREADCAVQFAGTPMVCAELGGFYWCLRRCDAGCAVEEECMEVSGADRETAKACVPSSNTCECTEKSVNEGVVGLCEVRNEVGVCRGEYRCTEEGLGICSAKVPRAEECNGFDDNCNGQTDEGFSDSDGDGVADCVDEDLDGDGDPNQTDCAPLDGAIFHGQVEACNGIDDDCDAQTDEEGARGCVPFYLDEDRDGIRLDASEVPVWSRGRLSCASGGGLQRLRCASEPRDGRGLREREGRQLQRE